MKCDGKLPCSYCVRRHRASSCCFSPRTRRPQHRSTPIRPGTQSLTTTRNSSVRPSPDLPASHLSSERPATPPASTVLDEEADVHREARLLCDAHGKLSTRVYSYCPPSRLIPVFQSSLVIAPRSPSSKPCANSLYHVSIPTPSLHRQASSPCWKTPAVTLLSLLSSTWSCQR